MLLFFGFVIFNSIMHIIIFLQHVTFPTFSAQKYPGCFYAFGYPVLASATAFKQVQIIAVFSNSTKYPCLFFHTLTFTNSKPTIVL